MSILLCMMSCTTPPQIVGTWSFCNNNGLYFEVSFLENRSAIICPEFQPDCRQYKYKVIGDSLLTLNLLDERVSSCAIIESGPNYFDISFSDEGKEQVIRYHRVCNPPLLKKAFVDTVNDKFLSHREEFRKRMILRGCIRNVDPSDTIKVQKMDTIFNDF